MCGWWIRELMDWSSGLLDKREVPTSPYHVARLPGCPIADLTNCQLAELTTRRRASVRGIVIVWMARVKSIVHARRNVVTGGHRGAVGPLGGMLLTYTGRERYEYLRASPCPGVAAGENTLWEWPKPGRRQVLPAEPDPRGSRSRKSPSSSTACVRRCGPATTTLALTKPILCNPALAS
jgi:hypothetical protein